MAPGHTAGALIAFHALMIVLPDQLYCCYWPRACSWARILRTGQWASSNALQ